MLVPLLDSEKQSDDRRGFDLGAEPRLGLGGQTVELAAVGCAALASAHRRSARQREDRDDDDALDHVLRPGGNCAICIVVTISTSSTEPNKVPIAVADPPKISVPPSTTAPSDCSRKGWPISRNAPPT